MSGDTKPKSAQERAEALFCIAPPERFSVSWTVVGPYGERWPAASDAAARELRARLAVPIAAAIADAERATRERCAAVCDAAADAARRTRDEPMPGDHRCYWQRVEARARELAAAIRASGSEVAMSSGERERGGDEQR